LHLLDLRENDGQNPPQRKSDRKENYKGKGDRAAQARTGTCGGGLLVEGARHLFDALDEAVIGRARLGQRRPVFVKLLAQRPRPIRPRFEPVLQVGGLFGPCLGGFKPALQVGGVGGPCPGGFKLALQVGDLGGLCLSGFELALQVGGVRGLCLGGLKLALQVGGVRGPCLGGFELALQVGGLGLFGGCRLKLQAKLAFLLVPSCQQLLLPGKALTQGFGFAGGVLAGLGKGIEAFDFLFERGVLGPQVFEGG